MALVISISVWYLFFQIPFAFRGDQAFATATTVPLFDNGADNVADLKNRFCGRIFAADEDLAADDVFATAATAISVCSKFFDLSLKKKYFNPKRHGRNPNGNVQFSVAYLGPLPTLNSH